MYEPSGLDDEVSLVGSANVLLRQRRVFFWTALSITGVALIIALLRPTTFTSHASFLPEGSEGSVSGALALAQQFGVSLGGSAGERTLQFYAGLIMSTEIHRRAVVRRYPLAVGSALQEDTDLLEYYALSGASEEERIERSVIRLAKDLSVDTDRQSGVVRFGVTTSDAMLSQGIASYILEQINEFDLTTRQSQAGEQRRFAAERLSELSRELRVAEDSLERFLIENRLFSSSPALQFEHDRLRWSLVRRQELVTSMAQAFERARIDEVRNTPVLTFIENPRAPVVRDRKRRVQLMAAGIFFAVVAGTLAALVANSLDRVRRTGSADMDEFSSLWKQTLGGLRRTGRSSPQE